MGMNIYKHTGAGHWIGSVVIVIADCQEHAEIMIRSELDYIGLSDEGLNVELVSTDNGIIHSENGDY